MPARLKVQNLAHSPGKHASITELNLAAAPRPRRRFEGGKCIRDALLDAGRELLAERPIDALAVDDIVRAAGVSKGSFYTYFNDKDELAYAIREDIRQEIEAVVAGINADIKDPAQRIARAFSVYVGYILASQRRASVVLRISADLVSPANLLNQGVMSDVAGGLGSGRFAGASVGGGALSVIGACHIALMYASVERDRPAMIGVARQLCAHALRGLGVPVDEADALSAQAMDELIPNPSTLS